MVILVEIGNRFRSDIPIVESSFYSTMPGDASFERKTEVGRKITSLIYTSRVEIVLTDLPLRDEVDP